MQIAIPERMSSHVPSTAQKPRKGAKKEKAGKAGKAAPVETRYATPRRMSSTAQLIAHPVGMEFAIRKRGNLVIAPKIAEMREEKPEAEAYAEMASANQKKFPFALRIAGPSAVTASVIPRRMPPRVHQTAEPAETVFAMKHQRILQAVPGIVFAEMAFVSCPRKMGVHWIAPSAVMAPVIRGKIVIPAPRTVPVMMALTARRIFASLAFVKSLRMTRSVMMGMNARRISAISPLVAVARV